MSVVDISVPAEPTLLCSHCSLVSSRVGPADRLLDSQCIITYLLPGIATLIISLRSKSKIVFVRFQLLKNIRFSAHTLFQKTVSVAWKPRSITQYIRNCIWLSNIFGTNTDYNVLSPRLLRIFGTMHTLTTDKF
jgi:hypothetical protein